MNTIADPPPLSGERSAIPISEVLQWVNTRTDARPVPELWVPGATLDELIQLGALGEVVAAVIGDDGTLPAAFSTGNLRRWIDSGHRPEPAVVAAFRALLAKDGEQHLAAIYSAVVSGLSRRTLGTFFTPADEADWMVRTWGARFTPPKSVVDVGAGVGIFSLRATAAWPHAEVFAVDINPVTLGLLALCTHDAGQEGRSAAGRVIPVEADFTVWIDTVWNLVPGPRLILGNPPYTRLQLMPATDRKRLTKAAGGLVGSRAALSAVITAQSLLALEPADGLALLLPAQWLEADYAVDLRAHLWKQTHRRVELRVFEEQLFADATVDAVALLVGPQEATAQPLTVSRTGGTHEVPSRDADDVGGFDRIVALARERTTLPPPTPWAPLGTFLRVRRGVATGANRFFILDADAVDDLQLSAELLTPMLRRTRSAPDTLTEASFQNLPDIDRRWLLTVHAEQVLTSPALRAYIDRGEKDGMDEGLLCRLRADWFDLHHDLLIPDLIIGQSSKHGFRVVENDLRAAIANNLYGMRWASTTTAAQREAIVEWLRGEGGQSALRAAARVQATGLLKIEPRALAQLPVPQAVWEVAGDDVGVADPLR